MQCLGLANNMLMKMLIINKGPSRGNSAFEYSSPNSPSKLHPILLTDTRDF